MFLEFLSQATLISVEEVSLLAHTITQTAKIRSWIHLIRHCCYFFRKLETTRRSKTMLGKPLNPSLFISRMLAKFKLFVALGVSLGYLGPGSFSRNNLHNAFLLQFFFEWIMVSLIAAFLIDFTQNYCMPELFSWYMFAWLCKRSTLAGKKKKKCQL